MCRHAGTDHLVCEARGHESVAVRDHCVGRHSRDDHWMDPGNVERTEAGISGWYNHERRLIVRRAIQNGSRVWQKCSARSNPCRREAQQVLVER